MIVLRQRRLPTPRVFVVGLVVFGAACQHQQPRRAPAAAPSPKARTEPTAPAPVATGSASTASLVHAMHDRYTDVLPRSITFVQKTTVSLSSGGQVVQTWYTAGEPPGRWRIDTDLATKGGFLHVGDSTFQFTAGKLAKSDTGTNE